MNIETYYYQESDAKRFSHEVLFTNLVILSCFIVGLTLDVTWWLIALLLNIALVRWMLAIHEIFHIQKYEQVNVLVRLFLIPFSPINVGYTEYRHLHMGHHKFTAQENDPDAFHIRGGHVRSFIGAFFFPEGSTIKYLKDKTLPVNWLEVILRFVLFGVLAILGGAAFWLVWFMLRVNYAIAIWVFFHHLHYRQTDYGTFALPLPKILQWYFSLLYGKPAVMATMHHDVHHRHPRVAAIHLEKLADLT